MFLPFLLLAEGGGGGGRVLFNEWAAFLSRWVDIIACLRQLSQENGKTDF